MYLRQITLTDVRQFRHRAFTFLPGVNLLVGENGTGKTTLLRSIAAVLGPTGSRYKTPILTDDDISLSAHGLGIEAEMSDGREATASYSYRRQWGGQAQRQRRSDLPILLIYGSNESTCASFAAQRKRRQSDRRGYRMHFQEEEWLYEEMMERQYEAEQSAERFGSSREIRHFVRRVLGLFSPNFLDFGWVFEPYRCTIRHRSPGREALDPRHSRLLSSLILRYFDERKRPFRTGQKKTILIDSTGSPIGDKTHFKRWDYMPPFAELLRQFGKDVIPRTDLTAVFAEIRLTPRIRVETPSGPLLLSQMSDGERRLFSIVVDVARQLSISHNRVAAEIEKVPAVVLIDEIDVHLHPKWQRYIIPRLEDLFPACQFIATTHSPFVVQGVDESRVQHLDRSLTGDFTDRGIEEIAVKVMGVVDHDVSPRYLEMLDAAREYFRIVEAAVSSKVNGDGVAVQAARQAMDQLSARYARNPAYQAFLEMNGKLRLGEGG